MTTQWSDIRGSRDRKAGLLIISDGDCYWFSGGSDINVRVVSAMWKKDGKWSHTSYALEVSDMVKTVSVMQGFNTLKWREGFCIALGMPDDGQWPVIAERLGVPVSALVADGKIVIRSGPAKTETEAD